MLKEINLARADLNLLDAVRGGLAGAPCRPRGEQLNFTASAVSHGLGRLRRLLDDPVPPDAEGRGADGPRRALAEPVAEMLAQVRNVVATAAPFDRRLRPVAS